MGKSKDWLDVKNKEGPGALSEKLKEPAAAPSQAHLTDLGNAWRFADHHRGDVLYCHPWRKWMTWDGTRYKADETGAVMRLAKTTVSRIYQEASEVGDHDKARELAKFGIRSQARARLEAMLELAKSEPGIPVLPDQLDSQPFLLNCRNGTLDLRTGQLRPHNKSDLITKLVSADFVPGATCQLWTSFVDRIMAGNSDLIRFLQWAVGYSLAASIVEHVIIILWGLGENGKSTFLTVLLNLLGDYAMQAPSSTFFVKRNEGIPNDLARLKGTRLVAAIETDSGRRLSESLIKQATGGDRLSARFLYGEWFDYTPGFKIWLATNHKPEIRGTDEGIWRRIRLVPFEVAIPEAEQDNHLPDKLRAEFPGILNWALEGCRRWQKDGLTKPDAVCRATDSYREEMDPLVAFLAEECVVRPQAWAYATDLFERYQDWCKQTGERLITQKRFGERLGKRGFGRKRYGSSSRYAYFGVGIRANEAGDPSVTERSKPAPELNTEPLEGDFQVFSTSSSHMGKNLEKGSESFGRSVGEKNETKSGEMSPSRSDVAKRRDPEIEELYRAVEGLEEDLDA